MKERHRIGIGWGIWVGVLIVLAIIAVTRFQLSNAWAFYIILIFLTILLIIGLYLLEKRRGSG